MATRTIPEDFGQRIRSARGHAGLSRQTVAEQIQMSAGYLKLIEAGARIPKLIQAQGLASEMERLTGFPTAYFFGEDVASPPPAPGRELRTLAERVEALELAVSDAAAADRAVKTALEELAEQVASQSRAAAGSPRSSGTGRPASRRGASRRRRAS